MIESDTIKLLRECDAGIKMGVKSIDDVLEYVGAESLKKILVASKRHHLELQKRIENILNDYHDDGKKPNAFVTAMSYLKTNMKLTLNESDSTIASLMVEGSDMGVKSLSRYLNQYKAADEVSKDIAKRLINLEEQLAVDIRQYL